jgi:hypothetical protein
MDKLCPEECWCDTGGYHVDCRKLSLNNIPSIFPTTVQELVLNQNNITCLENNTFISRGLSELEKLKVENCKIERIELGAFNGLKNMIYLSVLGNKINEILPRTFEKMSRLIYLDLEDNMIENLVADVFSGLVALQRIYLGENKLQYLDPEMFLKLPNLQHLYLSGNPSLTIPTDCNFINSHSLTHLDISLCNVSSVSTQTFANVTALEWLDLSENNLWNVDINILKALPKLSTMNLDLNPLQCDCQLQEVWRWCQDHNIQTASLSISVPECETPSEVQFMWWGVLEKGQCLEGNISFYGDYKNTSYSLNEDTYTYEYASSFLGQHEATAYLVFCIIGAIGNVILLVIIICNKDMRTLPNMYILNLAISDIIYLMVHFSEAYVNRVYNKWTYSDFRCVLFPFFRRLSVGVSAYFVAFLSIQRYRVTVNPFHIRVSGQPTWRVNVATICGVWIVAVLFAIPSALSGNSCFDCRENRCVIYHKRVLLFELLMSCVLPLCLIAFSYIMTARHLLKRADPIFEGTQNPKLNKRKSTAKIVVGLTIVFLISYVPYHVFWTYIFFKEYPNYSKWISGAYSHKRENPYTYLVSNCLLLINPCLNPVALLSTSLAFRRHFKRYLTCCCKGKSESEVANLELRRRN